MTVQTEQLQKKVPVLRKMNDFISSGPPRTATPPKIHPYVTPMVDHEQLLSLTQQQKAIIYLFLGSGKLFKKLSQYSGQFMDCRNSFGHPANISRLKQHECGDMTNFKFSGNMRVMIHIHFYHPKIIRKIIPHLLQNRTNLFAGLAPLGIEINQNRPLRLNNVLKSIRFSHENLPLSIFSLRIKRPLNPYIHDSMNKGIDRIVRVNQIDKNDGPSKFSN